MNEVFFTFFPDITCLLQYELCPSVLLMALSLFAFFNCIHGARARHFGWYSKLILSCKSSQGMEYCAIRLWYEICQYYVQQLKK